MLPLVILKALTFLPVVGLVGKAAYSAFTLHDLPTAGQDLANAAGLLGIGVAVHQTNAAVKK